MSKNETKTLDNREKQNLENKAESRYKKHFLSDGASIIFQSINEFKESYKLLNLDDNYLKWLDLKLKKGLLTQIRDIVNSDLSKIINSYMKSYYTIAYNRKTASAHDRKILINELEVLKKEHRSKIFALNKNVSSLLKDFESRTGMDTDQLYSSLFRNVKRNGKTLKSFKFKGINHHELALKNPWYNDVEKNNNNNILVVSKDVITLDTNRKDIFLEIREVENLVYNYQKNKKNYPEFSNDENELLCNEYDDLNSFKDHLSAFIKKYSKSGKITRIVKDKILTKIYKIAQLEMNRKFYVPFLEEVGTLYKPKRHEDLSAIYTDLSLEQNSINKQYARHKISKEDYQKKSAEISKKSAKILTRLRSIKEAYSEDFRHHSSNKKKSKIEEIENKAESMIKQFNLLTLKSDEGFPDLYNYNTEKGIDNANKMFKYESIPQSVKNTLGIKDLYNGRLRLRKINEKDIPILNPWIDKIRDKRAKYIITCSASAEPDMMRELRKFNEAEKKLKSLAGDYNEETTETSTNKAEQGTKTKTDNTPQKEPEDYLVEQDDHRVWQDNTGKYYVDIKVKYDSNEKWIRLPADGSEVKFRVSDYALENVRGQTEKYKKGKRESLENTTFTLKTLKLNEDNMKYLHQSGRIAKVDSDNRPYRIYGQIKGFKSYQVRGDDENLNLKNFKLDLDYYKESYQIIEPHPRKTSGSKGLKMIADLHSAFSGNKEKRLAPKNYTIWFDDSKEKEALNEVLGKIGKMNYLEIQNLLKENYYTSYTDGLAYNVGNQLHNFFKMVNNEKNQLSLKFHLLITSKFYKHLATKPQEEVSKIIENSKKVPWDYTEGIYITKENYSYKTNEVLSTRGTKFELTIEEDSGILSKSKTIDSFTIDDWFTPIKVYPKDTRKGLGLTKDVPILVPAFFMRLLLQNQNDVVFDDSLKVIETIASCISLGGGFALKGVTGAAYLKRVFSIADGAVGIGSSILHNFKNSLSNTTDGKKFLDVYSNIELAMAIGGVGELSYDVVESLKNVYKNKIKNKELTVKNPKTQDVESFNPKFESQLNDLENTCKINYVTTSSDYPGFFRMMLAKMSKIGKDSITKLREHFERISDIKTGLFSSRDWLDIEIKGVKNNNDINYYTKNIEDLIIKEKNLNEKILAELKNDECQKIFNNIYDETKSEMIKSKSIKKKSGNKSKRKSIDELSDNSLGLENELDELTKKAKETENFENGKYRLENDGLLVEHATMQYRNDNIEITSVYPKNGAEQIYNPEEIQRYLADIQGVNPELLEGLKKIHHAEKVKLNSAGDLALYNKGRITLGRASNRVENEYTTTENLFRNINNERDLFYHEFGHHILDTILPSKIENLSKIPNINENHINKLKKIINSMKSYNNNVNSFNRQERFADIMMELLRRNTRQQRRTDKTIIELLEKKVGMHPRYAKMIIRIVKGESISQLLEEDIDFDHPGKNPNSQDKEPVRIAQNDFGTNGTGDININIDGSISSGNINGGAAQAGYVNQANYGKIHLDDIDLSNAAAIAGGAALNKGSDEAKDAVNSQIDSTFGDNMFSDYLKANTDQVIDMANVGLRDLMGLKDVDMDQMLNEAQDFAKPENLKKKATELLNPEDKKKLEKEYYQELKKLNQEIGQKTGTKQYSSYEKARQSAAILLKKRMHLDTKDAKDADPKASTKGKRDELRKYLAAGNAGNEFAIQVLKNKDGEYYLTSIEQGTWSVSDKKGKNGFYEPHAEA